MTTPLHSLDGTVGENIEQESRESREGTHEGYGAQLFNRSVLIKSLNPSNKIPQLNLGTGILKI